MMRLLIRDFSRNGGIATRFVWKEKSKRFLPWALNSIDENRTRTHSRSQAKRGLAFNSGNMDYQWEFPLLLTQLWRVIAQSENASAVAEFIFLARFPHRLKKAFIPLGSMNWRNNDLSRKASALTSPSLGNRNSFCRISKVRPVILSLSCIHFVLLLMWDLSVIFQTFLQCRHARCAVFRLFEVIDE